jgi:hypothetical protein
VLAVKNFHMILSLLTILDAVRDRPGRCVKILLVSYSDEMWNLTALLPHAAIHQISPPPPKPKRKRAKDPWRDNVRARV